MMGIKLNVLLVVPRYFSTKVCGYIMPLGILYVSAALKLSKTAAVFTVNLNHEEGEVEDILRKLIEENHINIVGCGGISGQFVEILPVFQTAKLIKPDIVNIVGGGIITSDAVNAMKAFGDYVDYGCIGEGELTVPELSRVLANNLEVEKVDGLIYKDATGEYICTNRRSEIADLDSIPFPDYGGFNYDQYIAVYGEVENNIHYTPVAIVGGRSCKFNCTFCFHPTGSRYRQRSLDSIFAEIDFLLAHYKVNYIALREELFASDNERVVEFCQRIQNYPLVWSIQLRVDSINPVVVEALCRSGNCRYVFLGIESADNRILKSMRKCITIEQVESALDITIRAGLDSRSTIIFGDMEESLESYTRTLNWWSYHKKYSSIAIDMIIAFPGSALYKEACKNGRIPDPVKFLKDGCPIINLSHHLNKRQFEEMVSEVSVKNGCQYTIRNYQQEIRKV